MRHAEHRRWRRTPARYVSTVTPDDEIDGDEVCALCFAAFNRAGYDTGDPEHEQLPRVGIRVKRN